MATNTNQQYASIGASEQARVLAEAQRIASEQGISPQQALFNYAQANGISNSGVDTMMGFAPGSTESWVVQQGRTDPTASMNIPAPQGNSYVAPTPAPAPQYASIGASEQSRVVTEAQRLAIISGRTPQQELYNYAQANGISNSGVDTMMGYAPGSTDKWLRQQPAPQGNSLTPASSANQQYASIGASEQARVVAEARRLAGISGRTPEQELYNYAQNNGISNSGVDTMMGFASGSTDAWVNQQRPATSPQNPSSNLGMGSGYNPQQNPYLGQMGKDIGNQMFDNWSRNQMPSIRSGAMAAGGFGGSRQGVVEANGMNDMNRQYGQALTSMYGNDWNQQQNRNLQFQSNSNQYNLGLGQLTNQAQSTQNQYDLGLRSNDLGFAGLDANIYQNNFSNQMAGANLGLNAYNALNNSNAGGTAAAGTAQNQPINYFNNSSDRTNGVANGYGSQTSSQTNPGNPMLGALGGAQLGSQLYNQYMGSRVQDNGYSTGTGSAYAGTTNSAGVWSPNRAGM